MSNFTARGTLPLWCATCVYPKRFNLRRPSTTRLRYQISPRGVPHCFGCTTCVHPKRLDLRQRSTPRLRYPIPPRRGTLLFWCVTCVHPKRLNLRRRSTPQLRSQISPRGVLYRVGVPRACIRREMICDDGRRRDYDIQFRRAGYFTAQRGGGAGASDVT